MAAWYDSGDMGWRQAVDIPPIWLVGFVAAVWGVARGLPGLTIDLGAARILGAALALVGVALMVWAVAAFRVHRTSVVPHQVPKRIITSGPFALSRNPIYLGDVLVLTGAVLWWGVWAAAPLIPLFVLVLVRRFIAPEEARMKEYFGNDFQQYITKTRRWL